MKLRFISKKSEGHDVWSYFFAPFEPLEWVAGQSIRLELPRKSFGVSERRFTIASAPSEKLIQITTRQSGSRFKTLLDGLSAGDQINAYGVEGDFIWQAEPVQKIFVAAGIGITPYRSLLKSGIDVTNITLLYGTNDKPAIFEEELARTGVRMDFIRDRHLTAPDITGIKDWQTALIYLSGPETMVQNLYRELVKAGCSKANLKADLFTGNL